MEAEELRGMNPEELAQKGRELREEIFRLRLKRAVMVERRIRKVREGVVVSDRMQKSVVVMIQRTVMHPKYKKYLRRRTKVKAHDERNECRVGDRVLIMESRPLSRDKRWRVSKVIERAAQVEPKERGEVQA
jgi:small subunit ribosomal protein S17